MKTICPYCKQPMSLKPTVPPMRMRWQRIYQAVLEAGPDGISTDDLLVRMYADDEWPTPGGFTVLRVSICDINKRLEPYDQKIVNAFRKRYLLVNLKEQKDAKKVQSAANH